MEKRSSDQDNLIPFQNTKEYKYDKNPSFHDPTKQYSAVINYVCDRMFTEEI